jgi:HEAT repeat protein
MSVNGILEKLTGGDRRSIGRVPQVVRQVFEDPGLVAELLSGLGHDDPVVRIRAADALEKVSRQYPEWLHPLRRQLLRLAATSNEQEIRWHLAQMLPRIDLAPSQRLRLAEVLDGYLADKSAIVRVSALQALADLAIVDVRLRRRALARIRAGLRRDGPAVRARAQRLLASLERRSK